MWLWECIKVSRSQVSSPHFILSYRWAVHITSSKKTPDLVLVLTPARKHSSVWSRNTTYRVWSVWASRMTARQGIYAASGLKHTWCVWSTKGINYQSHKQGSVQVPSLMRELGVYLNSLCKDSYNSVHDVEPKTGVSMYLVKFKGTFIEAEILQPSAAGFSIFSLNCKN